ncbi:MAG: LysR substrate-binding domain-containing protein [Roseovarius sp.]|uniref:LysR substrate-binding domain-containing protein n=1 Tax=Roseovarius sp. TaxID=1486281 RepID=UPI0032EDA61D
MKYLEVHRFALLEAFVNLSFRQLQTFREVMRANSLSEAARSLGRTQPAVSAMIASLESQIGFRLFERDRGRLVPRPEAHYFYEEADYILGRLAQTALTMRQIGNFEEGQLRIVCTPATSIYFMPKVVAQFVRDRPRLKVSLMTRSSKVVEESVASQQYDIGLAEAPITPRGTLDTCAFAMPCACALPAGSPLAQKEFISPPDLAGHPLALLFSEHRTCRDMLTAFEEAGVLPIQRFETLTFAAGLQLVAEGLCVSICDPVTAASYHVLNGAKVVFRPFRPKIELPLVVLTPTYRPPSLVAEAFGKELKGALSDLIKDWH